MNAGGFLDSSHGARWSSTIDHIAAAIMEPPERPRGGEVDDRVIEELSGIIDELDDGVFESVGRDVWKLRLFFRPDDVAAFLKTAGADPARLQEILDRGSGS
jgi:hypothetical protein